MTRNKMVNGKSVALTDAENKERDAEEALVTVGPTKQQRIHKAESNQTKRMVRAAALGETEAIALLQAIEDEIEAIR